MFFRTFSFNYTFSYSYSIIHTQKTHLKNIIKIALSKNTFLKMLFQSIHFKNLSLKIIPFQTFLNSLSQNNMKNCSLKKDIFEITLSLDLFFLKFLPQRKNIFRITFSKKTFSKKINLIALICF